MVFTINIYAVRYSLSFIYSWYNILVVSSIDGTVVVFISIEELLQTHPLAVEDQPVSVSSGSVVKSDQVNSEVGKFKNLKELHLIAKLFPQTPRVLYRIFCPRGEIIACSINSN